MKAVCWLVLLLLTGTPSEDPDWPSVWATLKTLEAGELEGPGNAELAQELAELGGRAEDRARGLLLQARVERWRQRPHGALLKELAEVSLAGLTGGEPWLAVEVLPPGRARTQAVHHGLAENAELTREAQLLVWRAAIDEAEALRLMDGALPIQRSLHERYEADWSALDLCLTLNRLGMQDELDEVMEAAIERSRAAGTPVADLWSQWGVTTLGFGDTPRARDNLGRGVAHGSSDAGLVLGLLELEAGRHASARNAFRPSILSDPPSAWALRGWGLSLLPEARTRPAVLRRPAP